MMIYLQKRVIDQNGRSPSSNEKAKIRCGMMNLVFTFWNVKISIFICFGGVT